MRPRDQSYWDEFYAMTKDRPPRPLLVRALRSVETRDNALDLGSGALNETVYLLQEGFGFVTAIDLYIAAGDVAAKLPSDRFRFVQSSFEDFVFPAGTYDFINAQYALPFINPAAFDRVFADIVASLRPGGILCGQLFGDRDEWATQRPEMTFHTREQARAAFSVLDVLMFGEEDDRDGTMAIGGTKHWHFFSFVARR